MSATCPRCQGKGTIEPKRPAVLLALDEIVKARARGEQFTHQNLREELGRRGMSIGDRQLANRLFRLKYDGVVMRVAWRTYQRCAK
jgi:hypothetical protein